MDFWSPVFEKSYWLNTCGMRPLLQRPQYQGRTKGVEHKNDLGASVSLFLTALVLVFVEI
jgi:hypothetical protein